MGERNEFKTVEESYQFLGVDRADYDNGDLPFSDYFSTPPMFFTKNLDNVPFINRFNNGHLFLIAGGPSFKDIDKNKLSSSGVLTMGINNSPASFRPDLWTCVDTPSNFLASIWLDPKIEKIVPISHINKKLFDSSSRWTDMQVTVGDCPNVFYYRRNEVFNENQYLFEDKINWGNHSKINNGHFEEDIQGGRSVFLAAIRIAFIMGIRNLYLLGVDMKMDNTNKYHFEQDRSEGSIRGNNNTYNSMKVWFSSLKKSFDDVGFNIFNCNPNSAFTVFPHKSFDDCVEAATKHIPKNEKTSGMYDRRANNEKNREVEKAKKVAQEYSEDDRKEIKSKLDEQRSLLSDAKDEQFKILSERFPEDLQEAHKWAIKLKRPVSNEEMAQLYDDLKSWVRMNEKPTDPQDAVLYASQININKTRAKFKEVEKEKNKIWGIVK